MMSFKAFIPIVRYRLSNVFAAQARTSGNSSHKALRTVGMTESTYNKTWGECWRVLVRHTFSLWSKSFLRSYTCSLLVDPMISLRPIQTPSRSSALLLSSPRSKIGMISGRILSPSLRTRSPNVRAAI